MVVHQVELVQQVLVVSEALARKQTLEVQREVLEEPEVQKEAPADLMYQLVAPMEVQMVLVEVQKVVLLDLRQVLEGQMELLVAARRVREQARGMVLMAVMDRMKDAAHSTRP